MARTIRVHTWAREEVKEVTLQEAERILEDIDNDPFGGFVVDGRTSEVIGNLNPDTQDIIIIPELLLCGG